MHWEKISIRKKQRSVNVERLQRKKSVHRFEQKRNVDVQTFVFQKGFGAQKVTADFKEIERNAQEQEKLREQQVQFEIKTREENEKQLEKQMFVSFLWERRRKKANFLFRLGPEWNLLIKIWINNVTFKRRNWNNRIRKKPNKSNVSEWVSQIEGKTACWKKTAND